jgi:hypothetical protein
MAGMLDMYKNATITYLALGIALSVALVGYTVGAGWGALVRGASGEVVSVVVSILISRIRI